MFFQSHERFAPTEERLGLCWLLAGEVAAGKTGDLGQVVVIGRSFTGEWDLMPLLMGKTGRLNDLLHKQHSFLRLVCPLQELLDQAVTTYSMNELDHEQRLKC